MLQAIAQKLYILNEQKAELDSAITKEMYAFRRHHSSPMETPVFWELVTKLCEEITYAKEHDWGRKSHEIGIHNFFCTNFCKFDLVAFVKKYEEMSRQIAKTDLNKTLNLGDDGWGDFCDSVILNGEEIVNSLLEGDKEILKTATWDELYIEMYLSKKLEYWLPSSVDEMFELDEYETLENNIEKENKELKAQLRSMENKLSKISEVLKL